MKQPRERLALKFVTVALSSPGTSWTAVGKKNLIRRSETACLVAQICVFDLPNDGVIIARTPVSKFPAEPSALTILVDSCDVRTMVRFRDTHATVKIRLEHSSNALRHEFVFTITGGSWKKNEKEGNTSKVTWSQGVASSEPNSDEYN